MNDLDGPADSTTATIAATDILLKLMGKLVAKGLLDESEVVAILDDSERGFTNEGSPEGAEAAAYIRTKVKGAMGLL